jgi:hypothetical protein
MQQDDGEVITTIKHWGENNQQETNHLLEPSGWRSVTWHGMQMRTDYSLEAQACRKKLKIYRTGKNGNGEIL